MTNHTIGMREVCTRCDLELEWTGDSWHDRGGNVKCTARGGMLNYASLPHVVRLDCGHSLVPPVGISTGYATTREGERICYRCSDDRQRAEMASARRLTAYLSSDMRTITSWTGGKLGTVTRVTGNERQTFVRVTDTHGGHWAGIGPAESGTYVNLRRVK